MTSQDYILNIISISTDVYLVGIRVRNKNVNDSAAGGAHYNEGTLHIAVSP